MILNQVEQNFLDVWLITVSEWEIQALLFYQ